jgi:hypothetical protein
MAIDQSKAIDFIGIEKSSGAVILTISDHLEWNDSLAHRLTLQDKINLYLSFIESGEILESYPASKGRKAVISIVGKYAPDAAGYAFLEEVRVTIEKAGIGFRFSQFSEEEGWPT